MNKTIRGELQTLIAMAQEAQITEDYGVLEQMILMMAPHWHRLCNTVDRVRPAQNNWIFDQMESSSFQTNVRNPVDRPVVTR